MPDEVFPMVWGQEWYIRERPAMDRSAQDGWEPGLLLDAGAAGAGRGAALLDRTARP